jgi:hypothetical protein
MYVVHWNFFFVEIEFPHPRKNCHKLNKLHVPLNITWLKYQKLHDHQWQKKINLILILKTKWKVKIATWRFEGEGTSLA